MQEHRRLHGVLGLNAGATGDEVKRGYERRKNAHLAAGDSYRGYFASEAKGVLGDSTLRGVYAADGSGFALVEQRLNDSDDRWLSELLEERQRVDSTKPQGGKHAARTESGGGADKPGLIGGAMGWLGIGKKDAPAPAKAAAADDSADAEGEAHPSLEDSIRSALAGIAELMKRAEQNRGLEPDEIAATNDYLRTLVAKCSEDFNVGVNVIADMKLAPDLARLAFNPVDVEMKLWSSAAITLLFLSTDADANACLYAKNFADASVVTLYCDFIAQFASYFRELAVQEPGAELDLNEIEYQRSLFGNVLLSLNYASQRDEGIDQMLEHNLVQSLMEYLAMSAPIMSATQMRHVCGTLRNMVVKSQACAVACAPYASLMVSLLQAMVPVVHGGAVGPLKAAVADITAAVKRVMEIAIGSGSDAPAVHLELLIKTLAFALGQMQPMLDTADDVLKITALLFRDAARSAALRASVRDKAWDTFVSTLLSNFQNPGVPAVLDVLVDARLVSGVEPIGRRIVMVSIADEIAGDAKKPTPRAAVATLQRMFRHADEHLTDGFPGVAQAVVDKLLGGIGGSGPLQGDVLELLGECVRHATQLQPSLVSHLVAVLKAGENDATLLSRCGVILEGLAPKLAAADKIGADSQKYLVQVLAASATPQPARVALCGFFQHLVGAKVNLVALKDALAAVKNTEYACVRDLVDAVIVPEKEVAPAPVPEKKKEAGKKSSKGGEKSAADVEKKESKARSAIASEEAQLRNPLLQKFETEKKKIHNRVVERERKEQAAALRQQREEEEKRVMKLRKKTGVIERGEEEKRAGIRDEEKDAQKKMFASIDKEAKRLLKEAREASQREVLLQQAKEEAQRVAEEKQKEELRRQEALREAKERREEERRAAAAAADKPAAGAAPAPPAAETPHPNPPSQQDTDDIDALLAYASSVTRARLQQGRFGKQRSRRVGSVDEGAKTSYIPPAERRRIEEEAMTEEIRREEERLREEVQRAQRERQAVARQLEEQRAARQQRAAADAQREEARAAHERRAQEAARVLEQLEQQRADAERAGRVETDRREAEVRRLRVERMELEQPGSSAALAAAEAARPSNGAAADADEERQQKQQLLLADRMDAEAKNELLPPLPDNIDAQTKKLTQAWSGVLGKLLELLDLRRLLMAGTSNQEKEGDVKTLRELWDSREKLRLQIEFSMAPDVVKLLRDHYWLRISLEDEADMAGRKDMHPESVLPEKYRPAPRTQLRDLLSGFVQPAPPTPPAEGTDEPGWDGQETGAGINMDASALLKKIIGAGGGDAAPSAKPPTATRDADEDLYDSTGPSHGGGGGGAGHKHQKQKMYRNDGPPPTAVGRRHERGQGRDEHDDGQQSPQQKKLPEKQTVRMYAVPDDNEPTPHGGKGGKGAPPTAQPPPTTHNGKGGKGHAGDSAGNNRSYPDDKKAGGKPADVRGKDDMRKEHGARDKGAAKNDRRGDAKAEAAPAFPSLDDAVSLQKKKEEEQVKAKQEKLRQRDLELQSMAGMKKEREQLEEVLRAQGSLGNDQKKRLDALRLAEERAAYEQRKRQAEIQSGLFASSLRKGGAQPKAGTAAVEKSALLIELEKEEQRRLAEERRAEDERRREERRVAEERRRTEEEKRRKQQRQWDEEKREREREREHRGSGRGGNGGGGGRKGGGRGAGNDTWQDDANHDWDEPAGNGNGGGARHTGSRGGGRGAGRSGGRGGDGSGQRDAREGHAPHEGGSGGRGGRRGGNRR